MSAYDLRIAIAGPIACSETEPVSETPREALQSIWDDVARDLTRFVSAMGVPADRVEDVIQDVYLTAWQKTPVHLTRQELRRWLVRVTANRCHLEHRRKQRWHRVLGKVAWIWKDATNGATEIEADRQEERQLVSRALDSLDSESRTVLVLRYFEQYDSKEIGRMLGIPDSTVRSHLRRARMTLARALKQAGYEHE